MRWIVVEIFEDEETGNVATDLLRNASGAVAYFDSEDSAAQAAEANQFSYYDCHDLDEIVTDAGE